MTMRRAFAWAFSGQFLSFAVSFGGSVVLTRLLSPHDMGIYAIAIATMGLLSAFTAFGISAYVIREKELTEEMRNAASSVNAALCIAISLATVAAGMLSSVLLDSSEAGRVLYVLAITPLFGILNFGPSAMLQRQFQFKQMTLVATGSMICGTIVTVTCALQGVGYMSPAWGALTTSTVMMVAYAFVGRQYFRFRFTRSGWRPVTTFGIQMLTISGTATMSLRLSDIVLGRLLGLEALGFYSRASGLSNQIFENIYGTATRVMFSKLSHDHRETGELKDSFLRSFRMITAVMWPFLVTVAILSPVIVVTLYGDRWLPAALPLSVLLMAQLVAISFGMNWELFVIKGETATQTRIEITRNFFGLVVFVIGCFLSLAAAAVARVVDSLIGLIMYRSHVSRLSGASRSEIRPIYWEGAGLALATAWPVGLLMVLERWSAHTSLYLVLGALCLGTASWLVVIFKIRHPLADEIRNLLRRRRNG
jgi:O-antigen/teichoic acid export membrane protein